MYRYRVGWSRPEELDDESRSPVPLIALTSVIPGGTNLLLRARAEHTAASDATAGGAR